MEIAASTKRGRHIPVQQRPCVLTSVRAFLSVSWSIQPVNQPLFVVVVFLRDTGVIIVTSKPFLYALL